MTFPLEVSWDAEPDTNRRYWRIYLSEDTDDKGTLVTELDSEDRKYVIRDGVDEERDYWITVLPVGLGGTEGFWRGSGRTKHTVLKSFNVPSIPDVALGGGGGGQKLKVAVKPAVKKDPPAALQIIQGATEYQGKLVASAPITGTDKAATGDSGRIELPEVTTLPGQGSAGTAVTYHARGANEAGYPGTAAAQFSVQPLDEPNATAVTIASIVGNVLTGFSAAALTDGWEYDASNGLQLREIPATSAMTAGSGWGTFGSGGLLSTLKFGAHYVTSATVRSQVIDLGAVKTFALECYDEGSRESDGSPVFSSRTVASLPYRFRPGAMEFTQDEGIGPEWVSRFVNGSGYSMLPVSAPEWKYRAGDTVAAVTGSAWINATPMVRLNARYVQTSIRPYEPMGVHRWKSEKVYVRAWVEHAKTTLAQKPHDGVLVPVGQGGLYFHNSALAHTVNIAGSTISTWDHVMESSDVTASSAAGTIVIGTSGTYLVYCTTSFTGSANQEMHGHLAVGGVEAFPGFHRKLSGLDVGSAAFTAHLNLPAGATLALHMDADADSKSVTLIDGTLGVVRIR